MPVNGMILGRHNVHALNSGKAASTILTLSTVRHRKMGCSEDTYVVFDWGNRLQAPLIIYLKVSELPIPFSFGLESFRGWRGLMFLTALRACILYFGINEGVN